MRTFLIAAILLTPTLAFAHPTGELVTPSDLWRSWTFEPAVVALLTISAIWFALGIYRSRAASITLPRQLAFWSGLLVLAISQISPLHELGSTLFTAHMIQHELLILVAAPLLAYARPIATFLWALPFHWRASLGASSKKPAVRRSWRFLTAPATAWTLHAVALWGWHIPRLYQATLENEWMHALQHISFLGTALLFWWALMQEERARHYGASVAYIFTTAIHSGALGALLTFAPSLVYPIYAGRTATWGLTALEDQQLGGLIMWIPSSLVFIGLALWLFAAWLRESERRVELGSVARQINLPQSSAK